jgi:hypothetical protein
MRYMIAANQGESLSLKMEAIYSETAQFLQEPHGVVMFQ